MSSSLITFFCHLSPRVIVDVVTDVPADVEVDSARLLEVEVLGGDARQPEVDAEQHHHRLHRDLLVGTQHCPHALHSKYPVPEKQPSED